MTILFKKNLAQLETIDKTFQAVNQYIDFFTYAYQNDIPVDLPELISTIIAILDNINTDNKAKIFLTEKGIAEFSKKRIYGNTVAADFKKDNGKRYFPFGSYINDIKKIMLKIQKEHAAGQSVSYLFYELLYMSDFCLTAVNNRDTEQ